MADQNANPPPPNNVNQPPEEHRRPNRSGRRNPIAPRPGLGNRARPPSVAVWPGSPPRAWRIANPPPPNNANQPPEQPRQPNPPARHNPIAPRRRREDRAQRPEAPPIRNNQWHPAMAVWPAMPPGAQEIVEIDYLPEVLALRRRAMERRQYGNWGAQPENPPEGNAQEIVELEPLPEDVELHQNLRGRAAIREFQAAWQYHQELIRRAQQ